MEHLLRTILYKLIVTTKVPESECHKDIKEKQFKKTKQMLEKSEQTFKSILFESVSISSCPFDKTPLEGKSYPFSW